LGNLGKSVGVVAFAAFVIASLSKKLEKALHESGRRPGDYSANAEWSVLYDA
jgi:hypothetical protein